MLPDTNPPHENPLPDQPLVIPVIAEQLVVTKEVVETGRIRIVKQVAETNETINIPLAHDEYEIVHKPLNHYVEDDTLPSVRYEGNITIIPVLKEVLVKRTILVEEIWLTKRIITTNEEQTVSLRKEIVTAEKVQ